MNTLNAILPGIRRLTAQDLMRILGREWPPFLSDSEQALLNFIFQRTYLFNKVCESIPIYHFKEGIISKDGGLVHAGLRWSNAKIYRNLATLKKKGALMSLADYRGHIHYQINVLVDFGEAHIQIEGISKSKREKRPVPDDYVPLVALPEVAETRLH